MGRQKKQKNKNRKNHGFSKIQSTSDVPSHEPNKKSIKMSNNENTKLTVGSSPKEIIPIRFSEMKVVPYKVLIPGYKIKTGYEILAALEKYFSVPRENHDHESLLQSNPDEGLEIKKATSKKELLKKVQGRQKPKCSGDGPTKIKGPGLQRDPVIHVRPLPEPPFDMWWPLVPGLQVPEEDSIEVIGNMNKPWPRDPEEEAKWDKIPLPTQKDIHEQFQGKRRVVEMPGPREFQPGEVEELMRTRTTLADLKHYEETGELIVRE